MRNCILASIIVMLVMYGNVSAQFVVDDIQWWNRLPGESNSSTIEFMNLPGQALVIAPTGILTITERVNFDGQKGNNSITIERGGVLTTTRDVHAPNNASSNATRIYVNGTWYCRGLESFGIANVTYTDKYGESWSSEGRNAVMEIGPQGVLWLEHQRFSSRRPDHWLRSGFLTAAEGYKLIFEDWNGNPVDPHDFYPRDGQDTGDHSMKIYTVPTDREDSPEDIQLTRSYTTLGDAVYFRYNSNERWERYAKIGDYPDVLVEIGDKGDRIIFWRGASYRPFLETAMRNTYVADFGRSVKTGRYPFIKTQEINPDLTHSEAEQREPKSVVPNHTVVEYQTQKHYVDVLVPTKGDGTGLMFDTINRYAHARIVEKSPARIIVLWRYIPDFSNPRPQGWTEEYFTIYPDGICYRSVKTGTETLEEYNDPSHVNTQHLLFTNSGIFYIPDSSISQAALSVDDVTLENFNYLGFDNVKGSYNFEAKKHGYSSTINFELVSDIENPAIFVKNWGDADVMITIDGQAFDNYKVGYADDMDNDHLILWFNKNFTAGSKVTITPKGGGGPIVRASVLDPYELELPVFPEGSSDPGPFGAYYTTFKYWDIWDEPWRVGDYADVVVQFDESPNRLVFWRGTSYVPHWANDKNHWYNNEFCERRASDSGIHDDLQSLCEPMNEHECRYSNVKIIQSNNARAIVHWRYALSTLSNVISFVDETGWGDYVDEYFYVYPDESSVRHVNLYTSAPNVFNEWHEAIPVTQPGQYPEDILEMNALSVANISGDAIYYDFTEGFPRNEEFKDGYNIVLTGLKGKYKPYAIAETTGVWWDPISRPGDERRFNQYDDWPGWPEKYRRKSYDEDPETGYKKYSEFLPSHSSLMHLDWNSYESDYYGPIRRLARVMLQGMTKEDVTDLVPMARYWENPPLVKVAGYGYSGAIFDKSQKAYIIDKRVDWVESLVSRDSKKFPDPKPDKLTLKALASVNSPIINPCFVINNWPEHAKAKLYINGEEIKEGKDFRQGIEKYYTNWDVKSRNVIWVRHTSKEEVTFTIELDD